MTDPQFNTSADAFMWSALVQECRNSPHLQNVDFSRASLSFVREMLNHNTALEINKIPILLSKYIIRLVLVNVKPFIPAALSAHLKPENIRVEIESDELQLLLTRRQSAKPSLVTLVAKNTLCAMIGSSLDALRAVLADGGADKRSVNPAQPPRVTPITVVEPEPIAAPPRSVPGQFTDVFDATGPDRVAPSPARSGPTGATPVDASEMEVYPRSAKRFATLDRSPPGSASDVSGSVAVQPGSFEGGEGTPELDPVDAESDDDDDDNGGDDDDEEEEDPSAGDAGTDRNRVYDLNALYGGDEFASSGYGDGGDVEDDSGGEDGDSGTEEISIADPAGGDGHDNDNRPEKVLLGAKLMASAPDFTELVTRKRPYSQISDGSRSPIVADSDLPAVERSRKRLALAAKTDPGIGPFVVIASGDESDDGTAPSPRNVTDAHDEPISAGGEGINSPGGSRLPNTGVRILPDDDDGDELF